MGKGSAKNGDECFVEKTFLRALMDIIPDHIYFKDRNSRFTRINKALARSLNLKSPDKAVGKSDSDFFTEEHATQALMDEKQILATGESIVAKEEKETWPDGRVTWVTTTKAPLYDEKGNIVGTFGISRDITRLKKHEEERREMELRMQQTEKMESLGKMASGVAHDFNNLLMGVLGNASLALASLPENDPVWAVVKQIETTTLRASELTNQLLAYAGKGSGTSKALSLNNLVAEMTRLMEVTIPKDVVIRHDLDEEVSVIEGDPTQLRQVILNLITNAADAIGQKSGVVTIATGTMNCDSAYLQQTFVGHKLRPGLYAYVEVSDTGCGMSRETQEKIFDPFFTTKPMGRGLGLATVLGIVRSHAGAVKVHSEEGKGTTFRALFRASERPTVLRAQREEELAKHWHGAGMVLMIDDEDMIRKVSAQMLEMLGLKALTAASGKEGLRLLHENKDDIILVLLDEVMPGDSGERIFAEIRRICPDVKVVLCSGYSEKAATARFKGKRLAGFIQKPFNLESLAAKLKSVLANNAD